jgi:predicted Zn finger-like uncharacterized protein
MLITCPHCSTRNRVAAERLAVFQRGEVVQRISGALPAGEFARWMQQATGAAREED